jgi:hypothetical protein
MKGWLLIQPYDEYLAATNQSDAASPATFILLTREGLSPTESVLPLTYAVKTGGFLRVFAEHEETKIGANFNITKNVPEGNNGDYEIKGGRFESHGNFINVTPKEQTEFKKFFICHSNTTKGLHLRWEVGLDEFVDDEGITYV